MSRFKLVNWNKIYKEKEKKGELIKVEEKVRFDIKSSNQMLENMVVNIHEDNTVYDRRFGELPKGETDIREFSCECGALYGKFHLHETCEYCETTVEEKYGKDIRRFGWIDISPYVIINPTAYNILLKIIGRKTLPLILNYDLPYTIEGRIDKQKKNNINMYENIGMMEFHKRFKEIIHYYSTLRGKEPEANFILDNVDCVFSDKIPVTSTYLRPIFVMNNPNDPRKPKIKYDDINKHYTKIVSDFQTLKRGISRQRVMKITMNVLLKIQQSLQNIYTQIISKRLSSKTGWVRNLVLGARISFSSRLVIISSKSYTGSFNGVEISYKAFLELYFFEIISAMRRGYGNPNFINKTPYQLVEILKTIQYSNVVDDAIYSIIQTMIKKRGDTLRILMVRPPTLNLGSMQCMIIKKVNRDAEQYTLAIPISSLKSANGDFDGDVYSVYSLKEKSIIEAFSAFDPRKFILDQTGDNRFNSHFGPIKDQMTIINDFING